VSSDNSAVATAKLPISFPNNIMYAIACDAGASQASWGNGTAATVWGWDSGSSNNNTVVARVYRTSGGAFSGAAGAIFSIGY